MSIKVKVASTAEELQDVYTLRHRVYVQEEGYFQGAANGLIADRFDSVPGVGNIVAYHEGEAIGTMRANLDGELNLPAEQIFDYSGYRLRAEGALYGKAKFGGAGMLAIAKEWRHRRDVFKALISTCCAFGAYHDVTHILATVNKKSLAIYKKLGYEVLGDEIWVAEIGEFVVPVAIELARLNKWAFGGVTPGKTGLRNIINGHGAAGADGAPVVTRTPRNPIQIATEQEALRCAV